MNIGPSNDLHERLAGLDLVARRDEDRLDDSVALGLDRVHNLHGLDHAECGAGTHGLPNLNEGRLARRGD